MTSIFHIKKAGTYIKLQIAAEPFFDRHHKGWGCSQFQLISTLHKAIEQLKKHLFLVTAAMLIGRQG